MYNKNEEGMQLTNTPDISYESALMDIKSIIAHGRKAAYGATNQAML